MSNNGLIDISHLGLSATKEEPLSEGPLTENKSAENKPVFSTANIQSSHGESNIKLRGRLAQYQYIVDLLQRHQGNKSKTAAFLGITPRALRYRLANMREDGIDIECYS
ncbi:helix-turn-helix domain-containing protein [Yersinia enterocolitica]|uniref:helix-turn-helix domain-containing protein n=1 Tax=Yersinia enterocolitica TaxID=630 RepID=UPI0035E3CB57